MIKIFSKAKVVYVLGRRGTLPQLVSENPAVKVKSSHYRKHEEFTNKSNPPNQNHRGCDTPKRRGSLDVSQQNKSSMSTSFQGEAWRCHFRCRGLCGRCFCFSITLPLYLSHTRWVHLHLMLKGWGQNSWDSTTERCFYSNTIEKVRRPDLLSAKRKKRRELGNECGSETSLAHLSGAPPWWYDPNSII